MDERCSLINDWHKEGFQVTRLLNILEINRSTYYANTQGKIVQEAPKKGRPFPGYSKRIDGTIVSDEQIEEYLMEYGEDDWCGGLGYRKWTTLLKKHYQLVINHKKVYRLCARLDILKPKKERKLKHPRKLAVKHLITDRNQLWQMDIKYGKIVDSSYFVFVCSIIDVFDRTIVGSYSGPRCRADDIILMMTKALIRRRIHFKVGEGKDKLIIRTDNGPQFVSDRFGDFCVYQKIYHERIPKRTPDLNAYIESYFSRLQAECFDRHPFHFYEEAYQYIDEFIAFYNHERPHGSLNNLSPADFYKQWKDGTLNQDPLSI